MPSPHRPVNLATGRWLEAIYNQYHHPEYRGTDPIDTLDPYTKIADREIVALIAACLAYGNVKAIRRGIDDVLTRLSDDRQLNIPKTVEMSEPHSSTGPRRWLAGQSPAAIRASLKDFRYRVTSAADMAGLLIAAKRLIEEHGSLNAAFVRRLRDEDHDVITALGGIVDDLYAAAERDLVHLVPHPSRGSACKRLMLMLRWLVRCDAIDPGGWTGVRPAQLIVPLDTHLHRMALRLGLTNRRQPNLRTAIEITDSLRRFAPDDPLKYDFALTRPGILRLTNTGSFADAIRTS